MNKLIRCVFLLGILIFPAASIAQEFQWKVNLNYFFDNTEFSESTLTKDQTMAGVHFSPELGMKWDQNNSIFGGVDMLKKSGSNTVVDKVKFIGYYQFHDDNTLLRAGSFQKGELLSNYSDFFFQDSVRYYRPVMEGLYFRKGNECAFFNLWLDWTGYQTENDRESFFLGASGYKSFGSLFFVDFQSYMFHFATTRPDTQGYGVCDNLLGQVSAGVNYSNNRGLNSLLFSIGTLAGFERDRQKMSDYKTPVGLVLRANADYKSFGTDNKFYFGQSRMTMYEKYGTDLYWGNPFLRSGNYVESKWYWNLIKSQYVKGQLAAKMQFSEGKVFFEQVFTLSASIGNDDNTTKKSNIWEFILRKKQ